MKLNLRNKLVVSAVMLMIATVPTPFTARADNDDATTYRARLTGLAHK